MLSNSLFETGAFLDYIYLILRFLL